MILTSFFKIFFAWQNLKKIKNLMSRVRTKDSFAKYAPKSSNLNSEVVITYYLDMIFLDVAETKHHFNLRRLSSLTSSQIERTPPHFKKRKHPKKGEKKKQGASTKVQASKQPKRGRAAKRRKGNH